MLSVLSVLLMMVWPAGCMMCVILWLLPRNISAGYSPIWNECFSGCFPLLLIRMWWMLGCVVSVGLANWDVVW